MFFPIKFLCVQKIISNIFGHSKKKFFLEKQTVTLFFVFVQTFILFECYANSLQSYKTFNISDFSTGNVFNFQPSQTIGKSTFTLALDNKINLGKYNGITLLLREKILNSKFHVGPYIVLI